MLNEVILHGRVCADPELRYTPNQIPVVSFTLAVDRDYAGRDGAERQTDFIDCVAYRKTAEFVSKYFQKGSLAIARGRLTVRAYKDREGNARRAWEVSADSVWFGESRRSAEAAHTAAPASRPVDVEPPRFEDLGDDGGELPF
jgi:single-strand DNA-binding protein